MAHKTLLYDLTEAQNKIKKLLSHKLKSYHEIKINYIIRTLEQMQTEIERQMLK